MGVIKLKKLKDIFKKFLKVKGKGKENGKGKNKRTKSGGKK